MTLLREQVELLKAILAKGETAPAKKKPLTRKPKSDKVVKGKPVKVIKGKPVPVKKVDAAIEFLRKHPEYHDTPGRELEDIKVNGNTVSYKTWNEAKKKVNGNGG